MCVGVKGDALVACYCLTAGLDGKTAENGVFVLLYLLVAISHDTTISLSL